MLNNLYLFKKDVIKNLFYCFTPNNYPITFSKPQNIFHRLIMALDSTDLTKQTLVSNTYVYSQSNLTTCHNEKKRAAQLCHAIAKYV